MKDENSQKIATLISGLFDHILIGDLLRDLPYKSLLSVREPFGLDEQGYYKWYADLFSSVLNRPGVGEKWSEDGIRNKIQELLAQLATAKTQSTQSARFSIDFSEIAESWITNIDVQFGENVCYVPVIGLALVEPLSMGAVTFWPLEAKKRELKDKIRPEFFDRLHPNMCCVASSTIKAEPQKSVEVLNERVDNVLNSLRYISSLIWQDEPAMQMYIAGRDPNRIASAVAINLNGTVSTYNNSFVNPLPFVLNSMNLQIAKSWGLEHLQSILSKRVHSPLEDILLTAIRWFGDACQDPSTLYSFIKYYISLEVLLKKKEESAMHTIPVRVSTLLEQFDLAKRKRFNASAKTIVRERNSIFHSGKPEKESLDYLVWVVHRLARNTIHELRYKILSEGFETQEDVIDWVKRHG
ncbi:MAG: hypothetical protein HZC40_09005 [Chloroflexi bacterium]|nr:hypothetical protein [Chloroflexota bacterium]